MPIKLTDMQNNQRTCTLEYEGERAEITYLPSAYTPDAEDRLQAAIAGGHPSNGIAKLLDGILVKWEVVDDSGIQIDPVYENMRRMPASFLVAVIDAVTGDMQAPRNDLKDTGADRLQRKSFRGRGTSRG